MTWICEGGIYPAASAGGKEEKKKIGRFSVVQEV